MKLYYIWFMFLAVCFVFCLVMWIINISIGDDSSTFWCLGLSTCALIMNIGNLFRLK